MRLIPAALWVEPEPGCDVALAVLADDLPSAPSWCGADIHLAPGSAVLRLGQEFPDLLLARIPRRVRDRLIPGGSVIVCILEEGEEVNRVRLPLVGAVSTGGPPIDPEVNPQNRDRG